MIPRVLPYLYIILSVTVSCKENKQAATPASPPSWAQEAIWYQIFPERFWNGDTTNDPTPANISNASASFPVPANWTITPWTSDWYAQEPWAKATGKPLKETLQYRRYGGDLQGIINKLDYLQQLGINAIYLNPINDAPSLHKYDARHYHHVDVNFGPDPEGDIKLMQTENPEDPSTWVWTSADKLFLQLVEEVHKRKMKIIVDYSWNHTGVEFWAWKDVVKNQQQSKYKDWYEILAFDDPATPQNEFAYKGWLNISSLPELKKVDVKTVRQPGHPYEGNLHPAVKKHVFAVTERWLKPMGDVKKGIDGFRLDVADHIGMTFWREYRLFVKSINPNAYLVGEIWWEQWPDRMMDPAPYCKGDVFDAVMHYQIYRPARSFFAKSNFQLDAQQLVDSLNFHWGRLDPAFAYAMMNVNATHDAPRLLSCFFNPGRYKYNANIYADPFYKTGKPDEETYQRVKLYLMHQFTLIGAPHIWNGDEMGMWGGDDPDCRKPLWWENLSFSKELEYTPLDTVNLKYNLPAFNKAHFEFYRQLISVRKKFEVLQTGNIRFLKADGLTLMYERYNKRNKVYVMFNLGNEDAVFMLPEKGSFEDVMSGKRFENNEIKLPPLGGMIVKRR